MGSIFSSLFGGSAPKASTAPIVETEEAKRTAKRSRAALLETQGGSAGSELQVGQTSRSTYFGN